VFRRHAAFTSARIRPRREVRRGANVAERSRADGAEPRRDAAHAGQRAPAVVRKALCATGPRNGLRPAALRSAGERRRHWSRRRRDRWVRSTTACTRSMRAANARDPFGIRVSSIQNEASRPYRVQISGSPSVTQRFSLPSTGSPARRSSIGRRQRSSCMRRRWIGVSIFGTCTHSTSEPVRSACVNWRRTLPYVRAWASKYKQYGLVVIGVHTPEFSFEKNLENVSHAVTEMDVDYPGAVDSDHAIWNAFNNEYWPAVYLIDAKGRIWWQHFGEDGYDAAERTIAQLLAGRTSGLRSKPRIGPAPRAGGRRRLGRRALTRNLRRVRSRNSARLRRARAAQAERLGALRQLECG